MALPTISEIIQAGSPTLSTEPLGTAFDIERGAQQVFQAAAMKQQADWQRYSQFTKNIQDFMADTAKINQLDIAPEDRDKILSKTAEVFKEMGQNISAIANPMSNPAAYNNLVQKGSEAYGLAVKSKMRHAYDMAKDNWLRTNPEWNTPNNRNVLKSSYETDIEEWQPYQLGNPIPAFDIYALAEQMNEAAKTEFTNPFVGGARGQDGKIGKGSEFLYTEKGIKYDPTKYDKAFDTVWGQQDKYGNLFSDWVQTFVWDKLGDTEKKKYTEMGGDPLKNAGMDFMRNLRKQDETSLTSVLNKAWEEQQENYRTRLRSRSGGGTPPTPTPKNSLWDYAVTVIKPNEYVRFDQVDSYLKDFLQKSYEYEEVEGTGPMATKTIVKIPDDAYVSIQGDNLVVQGQAGKVYRNFNRQGLDALYSTGIAQKLSGKQDYETFTPVSATNAGGAFIPKSPASIDTGKLPILQ